MFKRNCLDSVSSGHMYFQCTRRVSDLSSVFTWNMFRLIPSQIISDRGQWCPPFTSSPGRWELVPLPSLCPWPSPNRHRREIFSTSSTSTTSIPGGPMISFLWVWTGLFTRPRKRRDMPAGPDWATTLSALWRGQQDEFREHSNTLKFCLWKRMEKILILLMICVWVKKKFGLRISFVLPAFTLFFRNPSHDLLLQKKTLRRLSPSVSCTSWVRPAWTQTWTQTFMATQNTASCSSWIAFRHSTSGKDCGYQGGGQHGLGGRTLTKRLWWNRRTSWRRKKRGKIPEKYSSFPAREKVISFKSGKTVSDNLFWSQRLSLSVSKLLFNNSPRERLVFFCIW